MDTRNASRGFTLIELLVVMTIIATLAGLGMVGIPAIVRRAERTASMDNLRGLYRYYQLYEPDHGRLPDASGPEFVTALWDSGVVDHTTKDAQVFFCPSTGREPAEDLSNITPAGIDWTGPDLSGRRMGLKTSMNKAADVVIVCHKLPATFEQLSLAADQGDLPLGGSGIACLTLDGTAEFIATEEFGDYGFPIIGPDSPVEKLQQMVPVQDWGAGK